MKNSVLSESAEDIQPYFHSGAVPENHSHALDAMPIDDICHLHSRHIAGFRSLCPRPRGRRIRGVPAILSVVV